MANSYKNKFKDELFPYVRECLLKDGRKASDSTVQTAISDMFYLERQRKDKDFLEWFSSKDSLLEAKEAIKDLLIKADRKNSNFDYDLRWYCRMLDYFYDYYQHTDNRTSGDENKKRDIDLRGVYMGEIIEIKNDELVEIKSGINIDANKIPKDKLRALLMDLKNIYGIGKAFMDTIQDGEYVLKIPKDIKEGMDKGFYWFCDKKDGSGKLPDVWGYNEEGKKLLKERLTVEKKLPVDGVADALYNHAQQQQMAQMMEELKEIHEDIQQILQGQTDDRFAQIEGAYHQLELANEATDPDIKRDLIVDAIGKLTDGESKIYKSLQTRLDRFKKIPQSKAGIYFKMFTDVKNYNDKKNKEADEICKYFEYYEKAMILIAYSFSVLNQEKAVNRVYKNFEERVLSLNTENFITIQNLHPNMDLSNEWYINKEDYSKTLEMNIDSLRIQNNDYFNLRIEGQLLKEAI